MCFWSASTLLPALMFSSSSWPHHVSGHREDDVMEGGRRLSYSSILSLYHVVSVSIFYPLFTISFISMPSFSVSLFTSSPSHALLLSVCYLIFTLPPLFHLSLDFPTIAQVVKNQLHHKSTRLFVQSKDGVKWMQEDSNLFRQKHVWYCCLKWKWKDLPPKTRGCKMQDALWTVDYTYHTTFRL